MTQYTKNTLTEAENSAWKIVYDLVEPNQKILDIGCSSGNLGQELISKKTCRVHGVDISKEDVDIAKKKLHKAWVFDVETDVIEKIKDRYDAVLLIDVIEHLNDPIKALQKIRNFMKKDGKIVFSIPNMAHTSIRLELLKGKFNYTETGLLDYTHLHFYTGDFIKKVFQMAGFSIDSINCTSVTYPESLLTLELKKVGLRSTKAFKDFLHESRGDAYQYIGVASLSGDRGGPSKVGLPKRNPHEYSFDEIDKTIKKLKKDMSLKENHIQNLEAHISHLEGELDKPKGFKKVTNKLSRKDNEK